MRNKIIKHLIVGAGPAAICEIALLLKNGIKGGEILWIDPEFKVGDFGTTLSEGSSVPGNTKVGSFRRVYREIYQAVPTCVPSDGQNFAIDTLPENFVCTLDIAAEPMRHITQALRKIVYSIEGWVSNIYSIPDGFKLEIKQQNDYKIVFAEYVTLAVGAKPRFYALSSQHHAVVNIHPTIAFIETNLKSYLQKNPEIQTIAVIGSSHSAALAVMQLLRAGMRVKQFMNKEYRYAEPAVTPAGLQYTKYDNTGLKGSVAEFTKKLLLDFEMSQSKYLEKYERFIGGNLAEVDTYLSQHLQGCSHLVACIGYEASNTLRIDSKSLADYSFDHETMTFPEFRGLYGRGIAFPRRVTTPTGETEYAVGVEKFWDSCLIGMESSERSDIVMDL